MSSNLLKMEQRRIQRLIDLSASADDCSDVGTIDVRSRKGNDYFYESLYSGGKRIRRAYLGTAGSKAVREHCRRRFNAELLRRLRKDNDLLDKVLGQYRSLDPDAVIASLPSSYGKVPREAFVDERYDELKAWAAADYPVNTAPFPKTENYAKDGRRVRSKGECIIYNLLLEAGIPFRYDSVVRFSDSGGKIKMLSPDFLIQCYDGTFIIIEHLGLLADIGYAISFGEKCYWFSQSGFMHGKNLFITSDNKDGGTDSAAIEKTVALAEAMFWGY